MKRRNLFLACLLFISAAASCRKVDTLMVKSPSMNKEVQVLVVTPDVALGKNADSLSGTLLVAWVWRSC